MRTLSLFLPGNYEDAYIYMGRLLILTAERSLRFYNFDQIIEGIEEQLPQAKPALTYLFIRNDWMASAQFKALLGNHRVIKAFLATVQQASKDPYLEIEENPKYLQLELELSIPARVLLDITVYNRRLYFGADTGLYHLDMVMESGSTQVLDKPVRRHDVRSLATSAGYGSINVSCGDEGLYSAFDEFGWLTKDKQRSFRRITEKSLRTAWSGQDLINYSTATTPILLSGIHERINREESRGIFEAERTVLTEIGKEKKSLDFLFEEVFTAKKDKLESVQYIYNSRNTFFIYANGEFITLGVGKREQEMNIRYSRSYKTNKSNDRILSIHPTGVGLIIETDDQVQLFSGGEFHPIIKSEVLSIRTFLRSKRYKNVVTITGEDGILITGFFDENIEM